jgi:ABC-type glutathione transport system ATPase component
MLSAAKNNELPSTAKSEPLLAVRGLSKSYQQTPWFSRRKLLVKSLDHVDLAITEGATLAVVGESGAGKSTLARCLALLERPSGGEIWYEGKNLLTLAKRQARYARQQVQLIFQDSSTAVNPRLRATEIIAEPLELQRWGTRRERRELALQLMEEVGLSSHWENRLPLEFSGGQRQRLAIARAIAGQPKVLILDEPLSGLDPPLQDQIIRLLMEVKERRRLTYVLISHDMGLVCSVAKEIAVLYQGRLVERGSPKELILAPKHPHTRALVAASPNTGPQLSVAYARSL